MSLRDGGTGTWTPETPWLGPKKNTQAVWPRYVCRNPSCKSYGKSHPHCRCGAPGTRETMSGHQQGYAYASGGEVHYCESCQPHQEGCEFLADGGEIEAHHEIETNPGLSVAHAAVTHGLLHVLTKTGHSKSEDPNKPTEHFIDSAKRGRKAVDSHSKAILDSKHEDIQPTKEDIQALKQHIEDLRENPSKLLDVGGELNMPSHQAALGSLVANAFNYFNALRPGQAQAGPLEDPMPVDKVKNQKYERQLGIGQAPLSVLARAKNGTISPDDIQTLKTLYPHLEQSLQNKTTEALIEGKTNGAYIPYKKKIGLSHILGQPLDPSLTLGAMQAIIHANGPAQGQEQPQGKGKKSGATAATLKQINKTDDIGLTNLQAIQIRQNKT
jgi:hypothetical protein